MWQTNHEFKNLRFFWEDLIEEQHRWSIEQMAMFYQTTEEEVISALVKANEKFATDPRSTCYSDSDITAKDLPLIPT